MTAALKALRHIAAIGPGVVDMVCRLNRQVAADLPSGSFITLWAFELDPVGCSGRMVCAGHHGAMVRRASGQLEPIGASGQWRKANWTRIPLVVHGNFIDISIQKISDRHGQPCLPRILPSLA
jgi:hypothetical protein